MKEKTFRSNALVVQIAPLEEGGPLWLILQWKPTKVLKHSVMIPIHCMDDLVPLAEATNFMFGEMAESQRLPDVAELPVALEPPAQELVASVGAPDNGVDVLRQAIGMEQMQLWNNAQGMRSLGFLNRTCNSLEKAGIDSLEKLCALQAKELLNLKGFGKTCLIDVRRVLGARGMALKGE